MARRPYITPSDIPTARKSRCLSFPDSLEWEALINGFLAMGTRLESWQQLSGGIDPEEAVAACVELLNEFFEAQECGVMRMVGEISMFGAANVPDKWLVCDGSAVSREDYAALFAVIGIEYGAGNETTTFNIPNFADRSPMGTGGDFTGLPGITSGSHEVTLDTSQMPSHTHAISDPGHSHRVPKQSAIVNAATNVATPAARTDNSATPHITTDVAFTGASITATGGDLPHANVHPVLGVVFMIYTGVE